MKAFRPSEFPWEPPALDRPDIFAIKAMFAGKASDGQQVRAMDVIVNKICGTYDQSFRPGGADADRATVFAEGKRFVGNQIIKALKMILTEQSGEKENAPQRPRPKRPAKRARSKRAAKPAATAGTAG